MSFTEQYRSELLEAVKSIDSTAVDKAIDWFGNARHDSRHIFTCGNGGSASTASHLVCDVLKGASFGRDQRFRILALTDSLATITAYSNDVCYDCVFEEQLKNFAQPGDVVLAISGSGNSPNVINAVEYGNRAGCRTISLTGKDGGRLRHVAQLNIHVNSQHMGRIEDAHLMICHMIAYSFIEV